MNATGVWHFGQHLSIGALLHLEERASPIGVPTKPVSSTRRHRNLTPVESACVCLFLLGSVVRHQPLLQVATRSAAKSCVEWCFASSFPSEPHHSTQHNATPHSVRLVFDSRRLRQFSQSATQCGCSAAVVSRTAPD